MTEPVTMDMFGFWAQADAIGRGAALLLLLMSIATWYLIVTKAIQVGRVRRRTAQVLDAFWSGSTLEQALAQARVAGADSAFYRVAAEAVAASQYRRNEPRGIAETMEFNDYLTRCLRAAVQRASRPFGSGLSVLASVGATAPFVGLFGTVWGIYHALLGIGFTGQATIDKVAGPVGEALIMTALGIAVAVPAVLGYNFLLRASRVIAQDLDGFAHDLHAYLTQAARLGPEASMIAPIPIEQAGQRGG